MAGEQAVVADAMEAGWQDMDEEAADELFGGERHDLGAVAAFSAVVLPCEGDAGMIGGDQAAVGDGDAVGLARQIGQDGRWSAERRLAVNHPFDPAQRGQVGSAGLALGKRGVSAEEVEGASLVRRLGATLSAAEYTK